MLTWKSDWNYDDMLQYFSTRDYNDIIQCNQDSNDWSYNYTMQYKHDYNASNY